MQTTVTVDLARYVALALADRWQMLQQLALAEGDALIGAQTILALALHAVVKNAASACSKLLAPGEAQTWTQTRLCADAPRWTVRLMRASGGALHVAWVGTPDGATIIPDLVPGFEWPEGLEGLPDAVGRRGGRA